MSLSKHLQYIILSIKISHLKIIEMFCVSYQLSRYARYIQQVVVSVTDSVNGVSYCWIIFDIIGELLRLYVYIGNQVLSCLF